MSVQYNGVLTHLTLVYSYEMIYWLSAKVKSIDMSNTVMQ